MLKMLARATALLPAALLVLPAGAAKLVVNGSFEQPNIVGGSYVLYGTGSAAITGWTVLAPTANESVQLRPDTYLGLLASDGRQWIDMTGITGYDKGGRSDPLPTVPVATYRIAVAPEIATVGRREVA